MNSIIITEDLRAMIFRAQKDNIACETIGIELNIIKNLKDNTLNVIHTFLINLSQFDVH